MQRDSGVSSKVKDGDGDGSCLEEVWGGSAEDDDILTTSQTLYLTKRWWVMGQN